MTITEQQTKNKITPYIILMTEILIFYAGAGGLLGIWKRPNYLEESNLQFTVFLSYFLGLFTFLFFVFLLLPCTVRKTFLITTAIFIITALPCLFLSYALMDMLQIDRPTYDYLQALKAQWSTKNSTLLAFIPHVLGFMLALALRQVITDL